MVNELGNLVLSRRVGQSILIADNIVVEVVRIKGKSVKLAVRAGREIKVIRAELKGRAA